MLPNNWRLDFDGALRLDIDGGLILRVKHAYGERWSWDVYRNSTSKWCGVHEGPDAEARCIQSARECGVKELIKGHADYSSLSAERRKEMDEMLEKVVSVMRNQSCNVGG